MNTTVINSVKSEMHLANVSNNQKSDAVIKNDMMFFANMVVMTAATVAVLAYAYVAMVKLF